MGCANKVQARQAQDGGARTKVKRSEHLLPHAEMTTSSSRKYNELETTDDMTTDITFYIVRGNVRYSLFAPFPQHSRPLPTTSMPVFALKCSGLPRRCGCGIPAEHKSVSDQTYTPLSFNLQLARSTSAMEPRT